MRTRALLAARSCVVICYLVALLQRPRFVFRLRFGTLVLSRRVRAPCAPQWDAASRDRLRPDVRGGLLFNLWASAAAPRAPIRHSKRLVETRSAVNKL